MMDQPEYDHRRLLYKLMYRAFLEIRMVAHEGKGHKGIFRIADLFHNVPSILERAEREGGNYAEIMQKLTAHADRNGSRPWLDHAVKELKDEVSIST